MTEVLFVGTSDAFGAGGRRQSAILIRDPQGSLLVDCGATTCTGLTDLGVERGEIDSILISHFHGDHFGGLPLLLLAALYIDARTHPLHIAGPPEIERRVRGLCAAMGHALEDREWSFPIRFMEVPEGDRHQIGPARVDSFATRHQLDSCPHGYRIELGAQTVAYSGDTGWFDGLPHASAGADLFICECTCHREVLDFHLNLQQLEQHRSEFDCGHVILTHLGEEMSKLRNNCSFDTADDGLCLKL